MMIGEKKKLCCVLDGMNREGKEGETKANGREEQEKKGSEG